MKVTLQTHVPENIPLLLMGGREEGLAFTDSGARTPIHVSVITKDDHTGSTWGWGGNHNGESKICNLEMARLVKEEINFLKGGFKHNFATKVNQIYIDFDKIKRFLKTFYSLC